MMFVACMVILALIVGAFLLGTIVGWRASEADYLPELNKTITELNAVRKDRDRYVRAIAYAKQEHP